MAGPVSGIHQCLPGVPLLKKSAFSYSAGPLFHFPGGMTISNRKPHTGHSGLFYGNSGDSKDVTDETGQRPDDFAGPDDVVNPRSKISSFLSCGMPTPSSS